MTERLAIAEIQELFAEFNSELCQKDEFIQLKRTWSCNIGRKLANSSNAKKRDQFKQISKHIRIMDHAYEENMELIYEKFIPIAKNFLPRKKNIDVKYRQKLLNEARTKLNLCENLAKSFIIRYKKSKKITFHGPTTEKQNIFKLGIFRRFIP